MTTFSASNQKAEDGTTDKMKADKQTYEPSEIAGAVNLMVQPFAGAVALSALGMGVAGHAFGVWMGFVSGAADASRRLFASPDLDPGLFGPAPIYGESQRPAAQPAPKTGSQPVRTATVTPIAEARERVRANEKAVSREATVVPVAAKLVTVVAEPANVQPVAKLMPEDFRRPKAGEKPDSPDDLKLISGVGPKLEKVLNGLGVWTFAQIAAWEPAEVAWVDDYLSFKGRIGRDGWVGQAAALAKKAGRA